MAIFWMCVLATVLISIALLRGKRVRVAAGLMAAVAVASIIGVVAPGSPAQAAEPFTVNISPVQVTDGSETLALWNNLYSASKSSLQDLEGTDDPTTLVFSASTGAKMLGLPAITGKPNTAHLYFDDAAYDLTVIFEATFLGQDVEVLVSARWTNTTDDYDPELAVVMRFAEIDLETLSVDWDAFPIRFTNALVGFANKEHTLQQVASLGTGTFFDDTVSTTTDTLHIIQDGGAFQAVVHDDPGEDDPLFEGAGVLGIVDTIVLRGTVGAIPGEEDDSPTTKKLDITATVATSTPPELEEAGVSLDTTWSLQVIASSTGTLSAKISGSATLDIDDDPLHEVTFGAAVTITYDKVAKKSGFKFEGTVGDVDNLFGQTWLDLKQLKAIIDISRDGSKSPPETTFSASLLANLTIGPVTAQATMTGKRNLTTGDVEFSLALSATGSVQVTDILEVVGAPSMDSGWDVELTNLGFQLTIKKPASSATTVIVAVTGGANLLARTCGATNYPGGAADLLFRLQTGGGNPTTLFVAGALTGLNVKNLSCDIPFEWTLPGVLLMGTNAAIDTPWSGVDVPTKTFFQNYYCGAAGTDCNTLQRFTCVGASVPCALGSQKLKIAQGFSVRALVTFDGDMVDALDTIGLTIDGPLVLTGTLPLFGGDTFGLEIALPPFTGGEDDLVSGGAVIFKLETDTTSVEAKISGTMDFRITRPNQDTCDTVSNSGEFSDGTCYDTVSLVVEIGIEAKATPPSIELTISASIFNWVHPFGEENLTFEQATLELGIKIGADGPTITVGLAAKMMIGTTDLTLSVWVEAGITPPRILVKGFTVGTAKGISLREIVQAFAPDIEEGALPPDLSLKNLWIAYGIENNNTLCIRQGLFISAELHLNDPDPDNSAGTNPACGGSAIPTPECGPGESSCLAAIQVDISPNRFKVYGAIGAFDLGPLSFGGVELLIDFSLLKQEFYFKGAATLYDPIAYYANDPDGTDNVWASGYLKISIKQDSGLFTLGLNGCALVGGTAVADENCTATATTLLLASIKGSIEADFTKLGIEFFTSASADFEVTLSSPALEKLMEDLAEELKPVVQFFEDAGTAIEGTAKDVVKKVEDQFCVSFNPNCDELTVTASAYSDAPSYISAAKSTLDTAIKNNAGIGFYCFATFDWPVDDCVQVYRNSGAAQMDAAVSAAGGVDKIALWGIDRQGYAGVRDADFPDVWYVNPVQLKWPSPGPALCASGGAFEGTSACGGTPSADDIVAAAIYYQLQQTDPTTAALLAGRGSSAPQSTGDTSLSDPGQFVDDIRTLAGTFDLNSPFSICEAKATFKFDENGAEGAPTFQSQVDAYGGLSQPGIDITSSGNNPDIDMDLLKETLFNQILDSSVDELDCPMGAELAELSFQMSSNSINEGDTLVLTGTAENNAVVTVQWGDGSTNSTATASATGDWTASHQYLDGPAVRVVKASTPDAEPIAALLTVKNVAPSGVSIGAITAIDEGGSVTVAGSFLDPGTLDTHTVTVNWGDGTSTSSQSLAAGVLAFSLSHVYVDDDPTGTDEDTYDVTVKVVDKDGASASGSASATVANSAPYDLVITSATWAGGTATDDGEGNLQVPEGASVTWSGTFRDVGVADTFNAVADWGDGQFGTVEATRDDNDPTLVNFSFTHTFADDYPASGTPSDLVQVRLRVTDDDTGGTELTQTVRITNVAPAVVVTPASQAIQYSDGTASVVLTATDVVGFIKSGAATEALTASTRWKLDDGAWQAGLFGGMTWTNNGCTRTGDPGDPNAVQTCTWTVGSVIANLQPGHYVIEFTVNDDDLGVTVKTADIVIEPEDARATYIGPTVVSAPSVNNGYIDVELRATIQDSSDVAGLVPPDLTPGDIHNATVTFIDRATNTVLCTAPVQTMFEGNNVRAGASCVARLSSTGSGPQWTYDVGTIVGGWYVRDDVSDDVTVTVVKPSNAYVTLGSVIRATSPAGPYGPDPGTEVVIDGTDFHFSKGFLSIQSQAYIEFTSGGVPYMGTISDVESFGMYKNSLGQNVAEVQAYVTIRSVARKQPSVLVGSHLRIILRFTGSPSTMSFAIFDASGALVAASNWDTVQPVGGPITRGSVGFQGMGSSGGSGGGGIGLPTWLIPNIKPR